MSVKGSGFASCPAGRMVAAERFSILVRPHDITHAGAHSDSPRCRRYLGRRTTHPRQTATYNVTLGEGATPRNAQFPQGPSPPS